MTPLTPAADSDRPVVLAAFDFSPSAEAAVAHAAVLAERFGWRLLVCHVVHDPAQAPGFYLRSKNEDGDEDDAVDKKTRKRRKGLRKHARTMTSAADDMLATYVADLQAASPNSRALREAEHRLEVGTPARRIVEITNQEGAVHIVMGTRGRGAWSGILLGSTAQRVVQLARVPVTLVKAPAGHGDATEAS